MQMEIMSLVVMDSSRFDAALVLGFCAQKTAREAVRLYTVNGVSRCSWSLATLWKQVVSLVLYWPFEGENNIRPMLPRLI